ncbi:MAG: FMN-binding protein [Spirochaetia bacterium]|nr:FMN-binding protein [Spirochaetia bacterium]
MKKDGFYALRIHPIIFMAIVTIVCIVITSSLFLFTSDRVKSNEQFFLRRSVLNAASINHDGTPLSVEEAYTSYVTEENGKYIIKDDSNDQKTVVERTGPGLWGPITIMVGFSSPNTLSGVSIVSQNETPGLGARIEEPWFTAQFAGKSGPFRLVEEGTSDSDDEIDSITGATRTSESFRNIINSVVKDGSTIYKDL